MLLAGLDTSAPSAFIIFKARQLKFEVEPRRGFLPWGPKAAELTKGDVDTSQGLQPLNRWTQPQAGSLRIVQGPHNIKASSHVTDISTIPHRYISGVDKMLVRRGDPI